MALTKQLRANPLRNMGGSFLAASRPYMFRTMAPNVAFPRPLRSEKCTSVYAKSGTGGYQDLVWASKIASPELIAVLSEGHDAAAASCVLSQDKKTVLVHCALLSSSSETLVRLFM